MKAMVYSEYGGPEKLQLAEIDRPVPKPDEVLLRVHAASVNSWDWDLLRGQPWFARLEGWSRPRHPVLGADVAGVVESIGNAVTRFKPGDAVFGDMSGSEWGGFAEYATARESVLALKPEALSFEAAAATPQAGMLALQALRQRHPVQPGDKVLINGAGGGVGTFAIQFARNAGAEVTGVDHGDKLDLLRNLGVVEALDFRSTDFTATGKTYDRIIDVVANRPLAHYRRALAPRGQLVVIGGRTGTLLAVASIGALTSRKEGQAMGLLIYAVKVDDLAEIGRMIAEGAVRPVIDHVYPLAETPVAMRHIGEGKVRGKLVITS